MLRDFLERIYGTLSDAITTIERTRARVSEAKITLSGAEKEKAQFMLSQLKMIGLFYYAANDFLKTSSQANPSISK